MKEKGEKLEQRGREWVEKKSLPVQAHVNTSIAFILAIAGREL
jgi:hypothetical protein